MMAVGALDRPGGEVAIPTGASAAGAKAPPAGEPTLDQLLAEPIVQQLMRRDRTNPASIRQLLRGTAAARITGRPKCPTARSDHRLWPLRRFRACRRISRTGSSNSSLSFASCSGVPLRVVRRSLRAPGPVRARGFDRDDDRARLRLRALRPTCSEAGRLRQAGANLCENPVTEGPTGRNVLRL
jgi:hypothetical protein